MISRHTLAWIGSLVALSGSAFIAGWQWPRALPELELTTQPQQLELKIEVAGDKLVGQAPEDSTLMLNQTVIESGEQFELSLLEAFPLHWWNQSWALVFSPEQKIFEELATSAATQTVPTQTPSQQSSGSIVASKSGKKYHPAEGCSYVKRIKPENLIYFQTREQAEQAGYEPSTCFKD